MSLVVDAKGRDLRSVSAELKEKVATGPVKVRGAAHLHGLVAYLASINAELISITPVTPTCHTRSTS